MNGTGVARESDSYSFFIFRTHNNCAFKQRIIKKPDADQRIEKEI